MKFKISANHICSDNKRVVITTNKIANSSDLNVVGKVYERIEQCHKLKASIIKVIPQNFRYFLLYRRY